ncbi:MAG: hypothetical protein RIS47_233 [Bacteroidota bacterium]
MIEFRNFGLKFGDQTIVEGFNLTIASGEKYLFATPSGTGKSSLLRILTGQYADYTGSVLIDGEKPRQSRLAYFGQSHTLPDGSVEEFAQRVAALQANKALALTPAMFETIFQQWGLPTNVMQQLCRNLSGGEQTRVLLATIGLLQRPYVLLDEPTAALDAELKQFVFDYFVQSPQTLVLASHDPLWQKAPMHIIKTWNDGSQ